MTPIDRDRDALAAECGGRIPEDPDLLTAPCWTERDEDWLDERVLVWRVERIRRGDGPYQPESNNWVLDHFSSRLAWEHTDLAHPGPYYDDIEYVYQLGAVRFGFVSLAAAAEWFAGWGKGLDRHGFRVVGYEVPLRYCDPGTQGLQVAFCRALATRVARLTCAEAGIV